jgi:hypothetical protein
VYDFCTDSFIREDFQQYAVGKPAVDEMYPIYSLVKGFNRTVYLWQHSLCNHTLFFEWFNLANWKTGE